MNTVVQLYGGGLDSLCISHLFKPQVKVYFHLGTEEAEQESRAAAAAGAIIDKRLQLADQVLPNKILPARNLLLVTLASYYGNEILLGSTAGDTTKDKDAEFLVRTQGVLNHILRDAGPKALPFHAPGLTVWAPAGHMTKTQLVRRYLEEGGGVQALLKSRSCYHGQEQECGVCRSCVRKYVAFKLNGLNPQFHQVPDLHQALVYAERAGRGPETEDIRKAMAI